MCPLLLNRRPHQRPGPLWHRQVSQGWWHPSPHNLASTGIAPDHPTVGHRPASEATHQAGGRSPIFLAVCRQEPLVLVIFASRVPGAATHPSRSASQAIDLRHTSSAPSRPASLAALLNDARASVGFGRDQFGRSLGCVCPPRFLSDQLYPSVSRVPPGKPLDSGHSSP